MKELIFLVPPIVVAIIGISSLVRDGFLFNHKED